ncbi:hypothetical protein Smp_037610 [Schistosoma mansoni]|uniref:hypothetical protein n=1 Tax=Schistosoma mansoni TaxID=6183 RepID=UPI0001A63762|nr:hypothetical protein Smp_037610 [Schistosoma mansoni]|eukprot:XP_018649735.1 hypothetical protein Smp_037610 [Schistosoma mansoni]
MNIIIESIEPFIKDNVEQQTTSNLSIQNPSSKLSTLNCDLQNSPITSTINHFSPTITLSHNDSKALNYSNLMNVVQSQSFIPIKSFYNSMEQMYESKQQHQSPSSQHSHSHHQQDHQKLSQIIDFVPLVNSKHYDANLLDFNQTNNYNHNPFGNDTIPTGLNLPSSLQQTPVNYTTGISLTGRWMFSHNRSVIQCFICRQSIMNTGGNDDGIGSGNSEIENLVKHLTIAHMLPLPIVMNYVITYMTEKLTEYNPLDIRINKVNNDNNNSTIESITASHTTVTTNDTTVTTKNSQNAQKFVNTLNIDPSWNTVHSSENTLPFNIPNVLYKDCRLNQCEAENLENFSLKVPSPPPQSQPPPLTAIKQPTSSIGYDLHDHVNNNYWICPHCNIQFDNFQQFHLHFTQNHNSLLSDMNLFNFIEGNSFSNNNNNNSSTTNSLLSSQMLLSAIQPKSINTAIISRSMVTGNNNNSTEDISLMPVINESVMENYDTQ